MIGTRNQEDVIKRMDSHAVSILAIFQTETIWRLTCLINLVEYKRDGFPSVMMQIGENVLRLRLFDDARFSSSLLVLPRNNRTRSA